MKKSKFELKIETDDLNLVRAINQHLLKSKNYRLITTEDTLDLIEPPELLNESAAAVHPPGTLFEIPDEQMDYKKRIETYPDGTPI